MSINKQEHCVEVANGKYAFIIPLDDERVHILHHGEPLYTFEVGQPSNALRALIYELDTARMVIQTAYELVKNQPTERLTATLIKHLAEAIDPIRQLSLITTGLLESAVSVLSQQNMALHEQVTQLTETSEKALPQA